MPLHHDTKAAQLRRPQKGAAGTSSSFCCFRKLCCITIVFMALAVGISMYTDMELVRSLNTSTSPMLRKHMEYLTNSASDSDSTTENTADTSQRPSNDISQDSRPHLYLHVGPQKTGSSTLQWAWGRTLATALEQDNYVYKHVKPEASDFDCEVGSWGGFHSCKASSTLKALIEKAREEGKNLLLSDENLDERFAQTLRDVIDDSVWQVTVIVMYRRIHEWLVSWYNEINKTTNLDANGKILLNEKGNPYRQKHIHWPNQGGIYVPSFSSWYHEYTKHWESSDLVSKHRSIEFYNIYEPLFSNVIFYNIHQEGDLVTNFMCDVVQNAPIVCDSVRNPDVDVPKMNPSVNLDYDILAVQAYDQGVLDKSLSRSDVVDAISQYVAGSGKFLPRKCDNTLIKQIRDWLIDSERKMLADAWHPTMEANLTEIFESYVGSRELCDLDFDVLFSDKEWIAFFMSLGAEEKGPIDEAIITPIHTGNVSQDVATTDQDLADYYPNDVIDLASAETEQN